MLPENVSMTKLHIKVVDLNFKNVANPTEVLSNPHDSFQKLHIYDAHVTVKFTKPVETAILFIQMETLSQSSKVSRIVGQSYFPLFIDKRNQMPCTVELKNKENMIAHCGKYQMPLYHIRASEAKPFTYERFIYHNRVPGASILVRAMRNKIGAELTEPMTEIPDYKDGVYSTKYFMADAIEQETMKLRRKRPNPPLMEIMKNLLTVMNVDPYQDEDQVYQYFFDNIKTNKKSELINLNFHS